MADYDDESKEWDFPASLKIHQCDLDQDTGMWKHLVKLCDETMHNQELPHQKDWACAIKQALDDDPDFNKMDGKGPWQCVVGGRFAAAITHESLCLCAFDIGSQTFLVYKNLAVMPDQKKTLNRRSSWRRASMAKVMGVMGMGSRQSTLEAGGRGSVIGSGLASLQSQMASLESQ